LNGGLWRDEALFLAIVDLPRWDDVLEYLRFHESHPPLFYAAMRGWRSVFGQTDFAALAFPVALGTLLIPLTFVVGDRLFGTRTGVLAALVTAVMPGVNQSGSTVRPYVLLSLLILTTCWLGIQYLERGKTWRWLLYGVSAAVVVLTHNWGWTAVLGNFMAMIIITFSRFKSSERSTRLLGMSLSIGALSIAFLPWLPALIEQSMHAGHSGIPINSGWDVPRLIVHAGIATLNATLLPSVSMGQPVVLIASLVAFAVFAAGYGRARNGKLTISNLRSGEHPVAFSVLLFTTLFTVGIAAVLSPFSDLLVASCLAALGPIMALIAAYIAVWLMGRGRGGIGALAGTTAVIVLSSIYSVCIYAQVTYPRSNAREVAAAIQSRSRPSDLMIIIPGWLNSSVNHYFDESSVRQTAYPDGGGTRLFDFSRVWDRMYDGDRLDQLSAAIDTARTNGTRVWLVSDAINLYPKTLPDSLYAGDEAWWALAQFRTRDVRAKLLTAFGVPTWRSAVGRLAPRQELIVAELFGARL
jgi:hypothetical protein